MMHGLTDVPVSTFFQIAAESCTPGHSIKLVKSHCHTDLRLYLLPAALRAPQICRYFVYSEADFEVFRPTGGDTLHRWGWNLAWRRGLRSPPPCQISPPSVQRQGCTTLKLKFLLRFDQMWNINAPQGRIPCAIFTKFAEFVPHFRMRWV